MGKTKIKKLGFSFLPIPEELMKSKVISWGAKFLFGIIAKANKEKLRWSVSYLSRRMDCKPRETSNRIAELRDNNLIVVGPRKGRVNEYTINFELIHIIQTPAQMDRGENRDTPVRNEQGGDDRNEQGNSKELSLKNPLKGSNQVAIIRNYFTEQCKKEKGFEPEMVFGKEGRLIQLKLKRYKLEQLKDLIDKFFKSRTGEDLGFTLSICLSAGVINQWLGGNLEKPKKPTYNGNPMRKMYGKWQVFDRGEWLEFADSESKIIYI